LRQPRKDRGGIAFRGGSFANGQCDFALGLCKAGQRIHQEQNIESLVAKIFGDGCCEPGAVQTHEGWVIRRGGHDNRPGPILRSQDALHEFLYFTASLPDQADNDYVCAGVARHHAQQHALTDTAAGEEAYTLAAAYGEQRVDRSDTHIERLSNGFPGQRVDGLASQAYAVIALERSQTIQRMRPAIDDPAEQLRADPYGTGALPWNDTCAWAKPLCISRRHQIQAIA
jgi:hypothetical protein